ncbi:MAG TPA: SRPBCC family protein [Planctomycetota bacterium]|nr:SRPBCC family protein [Planctomycetota bacterium]
MPTFRCQAEIAATREQVFAITQDDGRVWYQAKNGLTMTVRYVTHEPPERVAMTMLEGPWIFRRFSGSWVFQSLAESRTQVTFSYHFELKAPLAIGNGLMRRRLERAMNQRLAGLKAYAESAGSRP